MGAQQTDGAFRRGFLAMVPLWLGVVPFALAYAVTARRAGLSLVETQALSLFVFAGSAQFSAVGLFAAGAAGSRSCSRRSFSTSAICSTASRSGGSFDLSRASSARSRPTSSPTRRSASPRGRSERTFPVPARGRAQPVRHLEPRHVRRLPARVRDPRPDRARRRPDLPARLPRSPRAAAQDARRARRRSALGGCWPLASHRALPGGLPILVTGIAGSLLGAYLTRNHAPEPPDRPGHSAREVA